MIIQTGMSGHGVQGAEDGAHGFEHEDDFGRVVEIKVKTGNTLGYIVRKSDWSEKNYSDDQTLKF